MNQSRTYIKYRFCPQCGGFNLLMFQSLLSMRPMDYYIHVRIAIGRSIWSPYLSLRLLL